MLAFNCLFSWWHAVVYCHGLTHHGHRLSHNIRNKSSKNALRLMQQDIQKGESRSDKSAHGASTLGAHQGEAYQGALGAPLLASFRSSKKLVCASLDERRSMGIIVHQTRLHAKVCH